jgi:hypothetical protein
MKKILIIWCTFGLILGAVCTASAAEMSPEEAIVEQAKHYFIGNDRMLIEGFTRHNYRQFLNREAEPEGMQYWSGNLDSGEKKVDEVARGFGHSPEFINMGVSDDQFVDVMYNSFLMRESEQEGHDYYVNKLNNGFTRAQIMEGFIQSVEYANLILSNRFMYYDGSPWGSLWGGGPNASLQFEPGVGGESVGLGNGGGGVNIPLGNFDSPFDSFYPTPEPGTMILLGAGLLGLVAFRKIRKS